VIGAAVPDEVESHVVQVTTAADAAEAALASMKALKRAERSFFMFTPNISR
jgi:hypothetical protein